MSGTKIHDSVGSYSLDNHGIDFSTAEKVNANLSDVTKVTFTRDPYTKIFSAHVDKIFPVSMPKVSTIIFSNTYQGNDTDVMKNPDMELLNISFSATLQYAAGVFSDLSVVNEHFLPPSQICDVCHINYDVIGKVETYNDDVEYILTSVNQTRVFQSMGDIDANFEQRNIIDVIFRTFRGLRKRKGQLGYSEEKRTLYSCAYQDGILRRMWKHFQIRGYLSDNTNFPITSKEESCSVQEPELISMAFRALSQSEDRDVRRKQRHKYFVQAFKSVPLSVLKLFRNSVKLDCELFGYDCSPPEIFDGRVDGDEEANIFTDIKYLYM